MYKIKNIFCLFMIFLSINMFFFGFDDISTLNKFRIEAEKALYGCVIGDINYRPMIIKIPEEIHKEEIHKKEKEIIEDDIAKLEKQRKKDETAVTDSMIRKINYTDGYYRSEIEYNKVLSEIRLINNSFHNEYFENKVKDKMLKYLTQKVEKIKKDMESTCKEIYDLQPTIEEESKIVQKTTQEIANLYENLEKRGDPVDVSTGRFSAKYNDYEAIDFLDIFKLKRNYSPGCQKESFGQNWSCSIDSRIIKCISPIIEDEIENCKLALQDMQEIQDEYLAFKEKYNYTSPLLDENYNKSLMYEEKCTELLNMLYKRNELSKSNKEKNKYVTYGQFANECDYSYFENLLFYLTEDGVKLGFVYDNNGEWIPISELTLGYVRIKNLNKSGIYSNSEDCEGGYEVIFEDNRKKVFSPYGILEKDMDRNNNETIYKSKNGRIYEIQLKTGEVLTVERNDQNYITAIKGDISGSAYYFYTGDNLSKVVDNKKIEISYEYNESGDLISIVKNNKSKIKIDYEYNSKLEHNVVVAVTNANNNKEEFCLDANNRIMKHNCYGTGNEISKFDDFGRTYYFSDIHGNEMEVEYDSSGRIIAITKDGNRKDYKYDEKSHPISITYEDGVKDLTFYNKWGLITKIIDKDGLSNSFEYDDKGNMVKSFMGNTVCGTYWYYQNGLLKGYSENGKTVEFTYNNFGSVIEKTETTPHGKKLVSKWIYDDKNKLISVQEPSGDITYYNYEDNIEIITKGNYRITKVYNERNLIIKQIEEDLSTGEKHTKENIYDNLDNIVKVYTDGALLSEYEYYKNGILKSYIVWNNPDEKNIKELLYGIKTEYKYNEKWLLSAEIRSKIVDHKELEKINVVEYKYSKQNGNKIVTEKKYLEPEKKSTFNKYGKLIKEEWDGGYYKNYNYSKAGKLISVKDSRDNLYTFKYGANGSCKIIYENPYGGQMIYDYNQYGYIINVKDYYGLSYSYNYDCFGNLIFEKGPQYTIKKSYDDKNRNTFYIMNDLSGNVVSEYSIKYDDNNNTVTVMSDGYTESIRKYNVWGMVIESKDITGHYYLSYDYMGNCKNIRDYYGNETKIEYSPIFEVISEEYPDGKTTKYEYNLSGFLENKVTNDRNDYSCSAGEKFIEITKLGGINRIDFKENGLNYTSSFYDNGRFHKQKTGKNSFSVYDDNGNTYNYDTDKTGKITKETNPIGNSLNYVYAKDGGLAEKINYSGLVEKFNYDSAKNITTIEYSNGEKLEIKKNSAGRVSALKTKDYTLEYEYDKRGNLTSEYSPKTGTKIRYYYDSFGRCVKKSGADFEFLYSYDEMSKLSKVGDHKTGNWVEFSYDNLLRVKNKKYSNGMESNYGYNEYGQLEYSVTKNNFGLLIAGEFIVYDDFGRIKLLSDIGGNITKYKYDEKSRLISTEYPYSENRRKTYLDEATECGYYVLDTKPKTENISLDNGEINQLRKIYNKSGISSFVTVKNNQENWTEKYDYNCNGSIKCVTNPYGQIEYNYDSLNRVISKSYKSSNENGIKLKWGSDNLLEEMESKKRKISFSYGALKRPVKIITEDYLNGEYEITEYVYDALGRRVLESCNGINTENIYDGFSSNIISKQNITNNDFVSSTFSNNSFSYNMNNYNQSSLYRSVDNDKYTPFGDFEYEKEKELNNKKTTDYTEKEKNNSLAFNILTYGSEPIIISYVDGNYMNNSISEFVLTDYKKQITGTVDNNSNYADFNEFDTWGNCISGVVKKDNKDKIIYNLGYRDYIPLLKSFSSIDPVRDGNNWFAYCSCDPVNYCDFSGFEKQSLSTSDNLLFQSFIYDFLNFIELDYKDPKKRDENNCYMGLFGKYDCADIVAAVCYLAMSKANLTETEQKLITFAESYKNKKFTASKDAICSRDIYSREAGRKVSCGMDSEFFRTKPKLKEEEFNKLNEIKTKEKEQAIKNLKNPNIIKPGSVLVWKNSYYNGESCPSSCGHAVVVLSRKFDTNGNIVGLVVLEGHAGGVENGRTRGEKTELTYIDLTTDETDVFEYQGEFAGVYELEDPKAPKKESVCVK